MTVLDGSFANTLQSIIATRPASLADVEMFMENTTALMYWIYHANPLAYGWAPFEASLSSELSVQVATVHVGIDF